ncbi:Rnf103 [Symbiodinium pilosum]|uniref:Rnf103 protein n=1 Tax=Symbiodinium pilosum TaxID=2952 RepID=A0A812L406_SYMPI|nr:Rnf103 [Symbiodinium pilosum]
MNLAQMDMRPRVQILGVGMFGWSSICITCLVFYTIFPDKSSLPSMLLAMVIGSIVMIVVARVLISDRCRRQTELVQEHIWASMSFGSIEEMSQPKFHRVQIRTSETSKGTRSVKRVMEEVDVLWQPSSFQQTCVCCLEDFKSQDGVSLLPCGHIFHESCHTDWHVLKKCANACPICRDSWATV